MNDLDNPQSYAVDASGMFGHIERLGDELARAWTESASLDIPKGPFEHLVIAAMGGSAAAADYFAGLAARDSRIPVNVVRGYSLPGFVGPRSLVVALSYSGATEETLSCYAEAGARGAARLAISTGGALKARAVADGARHHSISYRSAPRAALGHSLAALLRVGQRLILNSLCDADVGAAAHAHRRLVQEHLGREVPTERNPAKQLAELLTDARPLVVLASDHLAPVGRRTKNQFAENAKVLASFEEVPEATHNITVGLEDPGRSHPVALGLQSPKLPAANLRRFELLAELFEEAGGAMAGLSMRGVSRLADQLEATAWGDYLSCYLAVLRGIDPTPTRSLDRVRAEMARPGAGK